MFEERMMLSAKAQSHSNAYDFLQYEVFGALERLNGKSFAIYLRWLLNDWYGMRIISAETVQKLMSTLQLNKEWSYLEPNPDGSVNAYVDKKLWDTFRIEELGAWIVKVLLEDVNFRFHQEVFGIGAYREILSVIRSPSLKSHVQVNNKNAECLTIASNKVFWTEKVKKGQYNLYCSSDKDTLIPKKLVLQGLQKNIIHHGKYIYARLCNRAAYYCYNTTTATTEIVEDAYLLNVARDGKEWSVSPSWMLQYRTTDQNGEMIAYRQLEKNCNITVWTTDEVRVVPGKQGTQVFRPYRITPQGYRKPCSMYYSATYIWSLLVDSFYSSQRRSPITCLTEALEYEKMREAPFPFTISQIRKTLEESNLPGTEDFIVFLNMLEEKGVDKNKDITAICYGLWGKKSLQQRKEI